MASLRWKLNRLRYFETISCNFHMPFSLLPNVKGGGFPETVHRACSAAKWLNREDICFGSPPPKNRVPGFLGAGRQKIPFPDNPSVCYADTSPYTGEAREMADARLSKRLPLWGSWLAAGQTDEVLQHNASRLYHSRGAGRIEAGTSSVICFANATFPKGEGFWTPYMASLRWKLNRHPYFETTSSNFRNPCSLLLIGKGGLQPKTL